MLGRAPGPDCQPAYWCTGVLLYWCIGVLLYWCTGVQARVRSHTPVSCQMALNRGSIQLMLNSISIQMASTGVQFKWLSMTFQFKWLSTGFQFKPCKQLHIAGVVAPFTPDPHDPQPPPCPFIHFVWPAAYPPGTCWGMCLHMCIHAIHDGRVRPVNGTVHMRVCVCVCVCAYVRACVDMHLWTVVFRRVCGHVCR